MDREIRLLLRIFDQAFEKRAWHGPNFRGSLRGVSAREASWRPAPGRHNIREISAHVAYWKYIVRRRLLSMKRGSFEIPGSNWFTVLPRINERAWREEVKLLEREHRELRKTIAGLKRSDLARKPGGSKVDNATMIYGAASHDLYHAGQVQLLKRLLRTR